MDRRTYTRMAAFAALTLGAIVMAPQPGSALAPALPPLARSSNVQVLGNVPTGPALGMV
jgi:hypothetical protein